MKKYTVLAFLLVGLSYFSQAQTTRKGNQETAIIKVPTVQCQECKERIEKYLGHEEGILKVNVDPKKKVATVTYLYAKTNVENVKAMIANVGYDADDVTAEPDAYKRLPTCCKKPEDGGGHEKH